MVQFDPVNDNLPPPSADDRRRAPRRRVLFQGKLIVLEQGVSVDCAIKDLSPVGARVQTHCETISASPFLIVVREAMAYEARTVWHADGQAGLAFSDRIDLGGDLPGRMKSLQRLWAELTPR